MRFLLNYFRPQQVNYTHEGLGPQDETELELFDIEAKASKINELMSINRPKAESLISKYHLKYWTATNGIERAKEDLKQNYDNFFQDARFSNTIIGGIGLGVLNYVSELFSSIEIPDSCPDTSYSNTTIFTGLALIVGSLQFLHNLNFHTEAKNIKDEILRLKKEQGFYKAILEKTHNEALLSTPPEVEQEVLLAI